MLAHCLQEPLTVSDTQLGLNKHLMWPKQEGLEKYPYPIASDGRVNTLSLFSQFLLPFHAPETATVLQAQS
jgi:hypothetical protein